jgi:lipopolysaccharide transport system ATP-binding protein
MSQISIQFEDVGKLYNLGVVGTGTLSHDLNRWWQTKILGREDPYLKIGETNDRATKGTSDFVWALQNISFDVKEGEVVGIIGKNGAGKSTLLKLLSRVTAPTTGVIRARGRIASLLEVGTGFHGEMTGRENIYMNGAILGMTKAEISRKLDEIVDFAGVERYIDTPVKRYSSGMMVRLGFSVAAFLEPEILVVDEVLAVGDAEFQKKAIGKMQDVSQEGGRTVLFVSHNMAAVRSLCQRGVVLHNGMVDFDGNVGDAIDHYIAGTVQQEYKQIKHLINWKRNFITVDEISFNGTTYNTSSLKPDQQYLQLCIKGYTSEPMNCEVRMTIKKIDGTPMASLIEGRYKGRTYKVPAGPFCIEKKIRLPRYLADGDYLVDIDLHEPLVQDFFRAPNSVSLHIEGFYEHFANPVNLAREGFIGLESCED